MALIKCRDCGEQASDKATSCPKCGCPISITLNSIRNEEEQRRNEYNSPEAQARREKAYAHTRDIERKEEERAKELFSKGLCRRCGRVSKNKLEHYNDICESCEDSIRLTGAGV